MLKLNIFPDLPSVEQATIRLKRLTPVIERLTGQPEPLAMAVIDSEPIPVCRYKRAKPDGLTNFMREDVKPASSRLPAT